MLPYRSCVSPPPSASSDTSSPVTSLITSGPVTNMYPWSRTATTRSVWIGEYTAPPAHLPRMMETSGTRPRSSSWRRPSSAYHASEVTASWILAPAESLMPMIGQPTIATHSISLATLRPNISPTEPWNTVWSWLKTPTGLPLMVPCPVTTPSPNSASGSPGVLHSAPISRKLPGSTSALMRARALGMPFFSRLATAFSPAGSLASSSFSRSSASFSAVVVGDGSTLTSPASSNPVRVGRFAFDANDRLAHMRADLRNVRLVDRLDVLAPDGHDLQLGNEFAPAAVGLAGGIARLEEDRVVVVAVGHVQRDVAVVRLDLRCVDHPVVQVGRPLMPDDPAGDLHPALADRVQHELHLALVIEVLELLVRDRWDLDVESPLGEARVAVPAGACLLLGLRDLLAGAHGVDQSDEAHVGACAPQADRARVGQHATQRPPGQDEGTVATHLQQLRHVLGGALLDGTFDPLDAIHRRVRRQSLEQRLVHHRRATRRVEHEHRNLVVFLLWCPQRPHEAVKLAGLEVLAHDGGQRLDGWGGLDVLGGDRRLGALRKPLCHLLGGLVVERGQRVEDAAR